MAKFYIKSGDLRFIINENSHNVAIQKALEYAKNNTICIGHKICHSEKGFISFKEWICYDIKNYMKEI